jgi:opacity protein-like surface antigen
MRKYVLMMIVFSAGLVEFASAQVIISPGYPHGGYGRPYPSRTPRRIIRRQPQPKFDPVVHFSLGYGYPNLDANELAGFYNYYRGPVTQTGPITGAVDIQYSRTSSIGVMVTHGQVSANYFNYNNSATPALSGSLDNWSVMLNLMNYVPSNGRISPYLRTAIGLNVWKQDYTDANGNKMGYLSDLNQFAYQVGLGVNIHLSKNTGIFMEGGYGKYIVHGGLSFKL